MAAQIDVGQPSSTGVLPVRRPEVQVGPLDSSGQCVVKDPARRAYYQFGEQEHFLLGQLDGTHDAEAIRKGFEEKFHEPFSQTDLDDFLALLKEWGLLVPGTPSAAASIAPPPRASGSILAWQLRLMDPDAVFTRLAPKIRFIWTPVFIAFALGILLVGIVISFTDHRDFAAAIPRAFSWDMALLAWFALIAVTFMHECAHGLTCKHFGGEVHQIGFLFLYFTPCFYCDVSDAWVIPKTSSRLWIMLAGSAADLVLWALAMIFWRATVPDFFLHDLAWVVASVCGVRIFFNMNPLIKLDGYYLLSDYLQIPNLRQHGWNSAAALVRRILWGAPRPEPVHPTHQRFILVFGLLSWLYSASLVGLMLFGLLHYLSWYWGVVGALLVVLLGCSLVPALFTGIFAGEVRRMFIKRPIRAIIVCLVLAGAVAGLTWGTMNDTASGNFTLRAANRLEVRAPVAGYLRSIYAEEGKRVPAGAPLALLEIPDLASRIAQKKAEIEEYQIKIHGLLDKRPANKEAAALQAHIALVQAEVTYLEDQFRRQSVACPFNAVILTPHVKEKVGQYLRDGDLICELEEPDTLTVEVSIREQDILRIRPGQAITLMPRASATGSIPARVARIAPVAMPGDSQSTVTVYCTLERPEPDLRSGMTGLARIQCGRDRIINVLAHRFRHFLRTEFWW